MEHRSARTLRPDQRYLARMEAARHAPAGVRGVRGRARHGLAERLGQQRARAFRSADGELRAVPVAAEWLGRAPDQWPRWRGLGRGVRPGSSRRAAPLVAATLMAKWR